MASLNTAQEKDPLNLTPKEFGAKLDQLGKHHNNLMKLAAQVYCLPKTDRLQYPNGKAVGRKEIRSLSSQYVKDIKSLKKNYVARGKRKKRRRSPGTTAGFKNPILVTDNMREFFGVANLGPSEPSNKNSKPLNEILAVGQNGVTTRAIMTPLFNIYAHVNGMQRDPDNKQFLTATAQMNTYFQNTYQVLSSRPQTFTKADKNGVRKPIPIFDPLRFRYASIQSIVADNTIKDPQLNNEQKLALAKLPVNPALPSLGEPGYDAANPRKFVGTPAQLEVAYGTLVRLGREQDLVTRILSYYRWGKSGSRKPFEQFYNDERAKKARK